MIEEVKKFAREHLDKNDLSHSWPHTERVYMLCVKIGSREEADLEVLKPAALLHDTGMHIDRKNHEKVGAELAEQVLVGFEKKEEVVHCIKAHRFSNDTEPETIEAEVLQDADNLDAMGAMGIARTMAHSGAFNRPIYTPEKDCEEYDGESESAAAHIREKLLKIKDSLNTETAKKMGEKRHAFMEKYLEKLKREYQGEV